MEFRSPAPQKGLGKDPEAAGLLCAEQEVVLACAYTVCPLHTSQTPKPVAGLPRTGFELGLCSFFHTCTFGLLGRNGPV